MEEEREARIEHLRRMAARRMGQQGLLRGWGAWHAAHEERAAALRSFLTRRKRLRG